MSIRLTALVLAALGFAAHAQSQAKGPSALPADINPITLSRLPPPTAADLDEEGQKLFTARTDYKPGPGPTHITIWAPRERNLGLRIGLAKLI